MENTPRIPDAIDNRRLAAMRQVAKMKELANRNEVGFIGGFVDDNGQMFVMSNIEDMMPGVNPTDHQLRQMFRHLIDQEQGQ